MKESLFNSEYSAIFPKINYIGNKEKLAEWIVESFPINSGLVLDMFSGGGSVSFEAKKRGFQVYSNDILYASFVVSKALIENRNVVLDESAIESALSLDVPVNERKQLSWLENKLFYPDEVDELAKLVSFSRKLPEYEKYLFQSLLRRAMIRKLPYSRMNVPWKQIVQLRDENYSYKKYGRKRAYHNMKFSDHMKSNIFDYNSAVFDNHLDNRAFQDDALEVLNKIDRVDIIYLDPPYPSTMNKYDEFYGQFDMMFDMNKEHSDLTRKTTFIENLESIIKEAIKKTRYVVLSLNSNSKPSINEISQMLSLYGNVNVIEKKHNYQVSGKLNKNDNFELVAILTLE